MHHTSLTAAASLRVQKFVIFGILAVSYVFVSVLFVVIPVFVATSLCEDGTCVAWINILIYIYLGLCLFSMCVLLFCAMWHRWCCRNDADVVKSDNNSSRFVICVPCYGERRQEIQHTVDSIIAADRVKPDAALMCFVVDGLVARKGEQPTADILLEILGASPEAKHATNYEYECALNVAGHLTNRVCLTVGDYEGVPYVVLVKVGADETPESDRGNRGKKDSVCLVLNALRAARNPDPEAASELHRMSNDISSHFKHGLVDYSHLMLIDADTEIDENCFPIFQSYISRHPECIGVCGETQIRPEWTILNQAQSFEYWYMHILLKCVEHVLYNVLVLSGCFAVYSIEHLTHPDIIHAFQHRCPSLHSNGYSLKAANILELGEDRYLTALLMRKFPDKRLCYTSKTHCSTSAPTTYKTLACQRRRWTNSLLFCHLHLLTNPPKTSLWRKLRLYYVLCMELWAVFMLPLVLVLACILFVWGILHFSFNIIFALTLTLAMFQGILLALCTGAFRMLLYWPAFMITTPFFSIFIPLYSLWNADTLHWGLTREVA